MKRPLQLSLAIALALGGTNALALGLGPVRVYSKLNQPLNAEIPVLQGGAGEAEGLLVSLAAAEDFERIGLNRSRLSVPLQFAIAKDAQGATVIKVTSQEPVRETYLDFLVEANWPKGRLLREYTVLLDPPLTAPMRATVATAPAATPASTRSVPAPPPRQSAKAPLAATPAPRASARPAPAAAPAKISEDEYGPVTAGETLSTIARSAGAGAQLNQMMLAMLKANPDAFYKNNINALKRGAILRIPGREELDAVGSATAAAAAVHAQIEDWRGGRASPTLVVDASTTASPAPAMAVAKPHKASGARGDDVRLELVPPKAGKDSLAMADRPGGGGAGSAAASSELKSELARTKESLTAREQEAGELKTQVKQLEDLKNKNDRLISLKDSEIAELQQKLKQLQAAPAATPAPVAVQGNEQTPRAHAADEQIAKSDIWGEATPPANDGAHDPAKATAPTAAIASARDAGTATSAVPSAAPAIAANDPVTAPAQASEPVAPPATPPATAAADAASTKAITATPATPSPQVEPTKPAVAPAAKPVVTPRTALQPAATVEPWYDAPWVKPGALGAGAVLLLLGLFGLRKRKAAPAPGRSSIADSFGDSPLGAAPADAALGALDSDARDLLAQLHDDPENAGLHLELLSVYYAQRDVDRFEEEAERMHAHISDPHQAEWLEAQAMGQELAPHNPLFADAAHYDAADVGTATAHAGGFEAAAFEHREKDALHEEAEQSTELHGYAPIEEPEVTEPFAHVEPELAFHLDAAELSDTSSPASGPGAASEGFTFEDLPPLDFESLSPAEPQIEPEVAAAPAPELDEDYFAGVDAIGTKLDLARAYMDMGDPDGARSMLEEVVTEGNDEQRAEAQRLLAELG